MISQRIISNQYQQRHRLYSKRVQRTFLIALNRQVKEASQHLPDLQAFKRAIEHISPLPIDVALKSTYRSILLPEGQITLNELHSSINQKGLFDAGFWRKDWLSRLSNWIQGNAGKKVTGATETTKKRLRAILNDTYSNESLSNQERAALIQKTLNDPAYNRDRSFLIARTETTTATNLSHSIAAESLSDRLNMKLEKQWVPTVDNRTRDAHEAMLLYPTIDQDETFIVGGEQLAFPGDPAGSAKNVVNCRCRVIYRVVRDARGRILSQAS